MLESEGTVAAKGIDFGCMTDQANDGDDDIESNKGEPETFENLKDNNNSEEDDKYELVT